MHFTWTHQQKPNESRGGSKQYLSQTEGGLHEPMNGFESSSALCLFIYEFGVNFYPWIFFSSTLTIISTETGRLLKSQWR